MEDSNTALLAAKLHHTSHMIKKFSHQAIHITRMKSLSECIKNKKKITKSHTVMNQECMNIDLHHTAYCSKKVGPNPLKC